ncbi:hypothetical protein [Microbacterium sp. Leaf159]|uniref:aggregation-promoting factor C-terminal-like domain-containing protein n=1 Tax=Microbacterium sp. Leaf159 TaxID=1736279 RepID=UPI0006FD12CB|nr:hypothetical protein [Microbacterium sp. Leaf159]KQR38900.1 phospholipase [Microbacterium sp. Leaf159]
MLHTSRALRRAHAAASARNAVTARRPKMIFGTVAGAVLGLAVTVGMAAGPAAGAEMPDAVAEVTSFVTGGEPLAKIADDSAITIALAEDAVTAADALNAEVAASGLDLGADPSSVATDELAADIDRLSGDRDSMSALLLSSVAVATSTGTDDVIAGTAALEASFTAAQEKKAADDAAQAAAEQAAAEAAALAQANTPEGAKATARQMMADKYGWGEDQFSCLNSLWTKESGWNYQAYNASGGATGIPQALPGSKMASAGSDWQTNAATQIAWGLGYIDSVYGAPCSAWGHSQASNWY